MQNLMITVDDSSPTFHYSPLPVWSSATFLEDANLSSYFENTTTYTNTSQANVTFEFWGSSIQIIGTKSQNHGNFQVQLDDQVFDSLSGHSDPPASYQQQLFAQSGLSSGKHEVVITNMLDGMFLDIDFVTWDPVLDEGGGNVILNTIPDDSPAIVYSDSWGTDPSQLGTFVGGTGHATKKPGSFLEFNFTGIALAIYGPADPNGAPYTVQVDNSTQQNYSFYTSRYTPQSLLFFQGSLDMGVDEHTVRITHAGIGSHENKTLAIDFINVYSRSIFEIRAMDTGGGGTSKSTIAAIIMGIIAGLLLFLVALMYYLNRKKKLGQFEWNIFKRDSWNLSKPETARRVRREDVTEGFELDGGGYAAVMTSEGSATRIDPGTARTAASVTSGDDSEAGLITQHRDEISEIVSSPARPNKQRWSFSGLSVLNQPLVIPKSSMGIIGMSGAARQLNIPSGQSGQRNLTAASASVPIPLPPGLAGTSSGAFANSRSKRPETILSWKPEPENSQSTPSEAPPPPPVPETSEELPLYPKETSKTPKKDSPVLRERPSLRVHQFGSEGSLPLRSALPEPDAPFPFPPPEISRRSPIGQRELLLHRIPSMPPSPFSGGGPSVQSATETSGTFEPQEMLTPTSGPSERSSTSIDWSLSRPTSSQGGSVSRSPRSKRERPKSTGSILGPRMRVPRTSPQNSKRGRDLGELSRADKKDEEETE